MVPHHTVMLFPTSSSPRRTIAPLASTVVALAAVALATWAPLATEEISVVRLGSAPETIVLEQGRSLTQTFRAHGERITGIALFAEAERWDGRGLRVRIVDEHGQERVRGLSVRTSFQPGLTKIVVPLRVVPTSSGEPLGVEVFLDHGAPLRLRTTTEDVLPHGTLVTPEGVHLDRDLALSVTTPARVSPGTRLGVIVGAVVLIAASLLPLAGARRSWGAAVCLLLLATPLALGGFWFSPGEWGISDWDYYFSLHETYRRSILEWHTFPFWNPATCGGTAGLADPEFPVFTPTFLLELLFGIPTGLRLAIFLSVAVGSIGVLFLGGRLGLSVEGALVGALGASFGSVNLLELVEGHVNIFAAMWIPWIFWAWLRAYQGTRGQGPGDRAAHVRWSLLCGVFLALTFFQGGIYLLSYMLLAFIVLPSLVSRPRDAIRVTVVGGLWALGLSAVKLLPVLFWLAEFPDEIYAGSTVTLPWLAEILLGRHLHGATILPDQRSGWHEYGAYVGPVVLALALIGSARMLRERTSRALVVSTLLAVLLSSAGPFLEPLFDVLPFIPRSSISRVILFAVIPLSLLAGMGLDVLRHSAHWGRPLASLLVGVVAIDLFSLAFPLSLQAFVLPGIHTAIPPASFPIAFTRETYATEARGEKHTRAYAATLAGYGTLSYCSVLGPRSMVKTIHDEDNAYITLDPPRAGTVALTDWSPNLLRVRAELREPARVVVNTNATKGWRVDGQVAENVNGRVGASVPPGRHEFTFTFRTKGFTAGALITVATLLLMVTPRRLLGRRTVQPRR